jgi:hypothetical protein
MMAPGGEQLSLLDRRRTRADQIFRRFREFHLANPHIWALFQRFTAELRDAGHPHYSADAILHRIRWHLSVEVQSGDGLKLNNDFAAYYARMWVEMHADAGHFFSLRYRTSAERPPAEHDIAVWNSGVPAGEGALRAQLRVLAGIA